MNEFDYKALLKLYETKNITVTAKELYISQPALTKKIKNIEDELNVKIIIRSTKGIAFTSAGEHIIRHVKKVYTELQDMKEGLSNIANDVQGLLRLGISAIYSYYEFPSIIGNFLENFPKVNLSIVTDNSSIIYKMLMDKKLSLAILRHEYNWQYEKKLLFSEPVCLACNKYISSDKLNNTTYIKYKTSPALQNLMENWLFENNIMESESVITTSDIKTCVKLISGNIGWSILPSLALKNYQGYKEPLRWKDGSSFMRHTFLYYRKEDLQYKQIKSFILYLSSLYGFKIG